nr:MAG TPA: hypothetical protein [Caudoviricetes sp.]
MVKKVLTLLKFSDIMFIKQGGTGYAPPKNIIR